VLSEPVAVFLMSRYVSNIWPLVAEQETVFRPLRRVLLGLQGHKMRFTT
jgi:hypothetical protein